MSEKRDYFKFITGKTFEEFTRIPTYEEIIDSQWDDIVSGEDKVVIGTGTKGLLKIADSKRVHIHIIGEPKMGKSKTEEGLVQDNIDKGRALLFLDSSDNGDTAYNILRYCAHKKLKKVIFIDTFHAKEYGKVIGLNPFIYTSLWEDESVKNVENIIQVLFDTKDLTSTPNIQVYLKAILFLLIRAERPLSDAKFLTSPKYVRQRIEILNKSPKNDYSRTLIEDLFNNPYRQDEIRSTFRRLDPLFSFPMNLMLSRRELEFMRLLADGWVIIVNLSAYGLGTVEKKLIATLLINQAILAARRLKRPDFNMKEGHNRKPIWSGNIYMYLDEAGDYANSYLVDLMSKGRKSGLRVTIAHQFFAQFSDQKLLKGIRNTSNTKIAFHIQDAGDRNEIVKDMYGGDLSDREVAYQLSKKEQREAVVKVGSGDAMIIKTRDVITPEVSDQQMYDYLMQIYSQPFYYSTSELEQEYEAKFPITEGEDNQSSGRTTRPLNAGPDKSNWPGKRSSSKKGTDTDEQPRSEEEIRRTRALFMEAEGTERDQSKADRSRQNADKPLRRTKKNRGADDMD